jgi:DNA-binding beta-propeller fold protein YncE
MTWKETKNMASAARRTTAVIGLTVAALGLAACSGNSPAKAHGAAAISMLPQHILHAPKSMLSATEPQANGAMWALAGPSSAGLFEISSPTGKIKTSFSVSDNARSVAESSTGTLALALGSNQSGALELVNSQTRKAIATVPLPAPARQVVVGSDGTTFYVLTGWATTASVTIVGGRSGRVEGTVPMPSDAVSIVPDIQQATIYALERNGLVDQIGLSKGRIQAKFKVGDGDTGQSITLSPDGSTLYVLKELGGISNIAVVDAATEAVKDVLPAPSNCVEVMVSPGGGQLYEVVGTPRYGNIQIFAV